ncbi:MAG: hypothetical protein IJ817_00780 [Clostridia bacterium]|nr:hypothetical protein [Clostridia bacterium]
MSNNVVASFRLSKDARYFVLANFFPGDAEENKDVTDPIFNIGIKENMPLHAAALCLYTSLFLTETHENFPQVDEYFDTKQKKPGFNCSQRARQICSEIHKENPNLSQREIDNIAKEQLKRELRNAFAHGSFKLSFDGNGQPVFIVSTNRYGSTSHMPVSFSFEEIYQTLAKENENKFSALVGESKTKKLHEIARQLNEKSEGSEELLSFVFPRLLLHLARYFMNGQYGIGRIDTELAKRYSTSLQYLFASSVIAYEQSKYHEVLGNDSPIFKFLSAVRVSLVHKAITLSGNENKITFGTLKSKFDGIVDKENDADKLGVEVEIALAYADYMLLQKEGDLGEARAKKDHIKKMFIKLSDMQEQNEEKKSQLFNVLENENLELEEKITILFGIHDKTAEEKITTKNTTDGMEK